MLCDQCGAQNPDENNFCGRCGVRLLRHPIPKFAEPPTSLAEPAQAPWTSSVGGALSSLGVDDLKKGKDVAKWEPETAVVVAADPIKPPAYLKEEKIPPVPHSVVERTLPQRTLDEERDEPTTISGPSFLGLTDTSSDSDQSSYLLEDNRSGSGGAWVVLLLLLAILGGIIWWQRDAIQRAGFGIPFLHSAAQEPPSNTQPAQNADSTATPSPQPNKTSADDAERFTTTDPNSAADDVKSTAPTSGSGSGAASSNSPETKADDTAATESSLSRQTQEAKQRQADQAPSDKADQSPSDEKPMLSAADAKPAPGAADAQPNPQQNKLLLAGERYLYGRGVTKSCEQAMIYFRAAADENNVPAMSHLAALYNSGECVKQDTGQAYGWLLRAHDADPNNTWIERDLEMMKRQTAAK